MRRRELTYSVDEKTGCWNCTSHSKTTTVNYPRIYRNGKKYLLHRYVYEINNGQIPNGLVVRHSCDNTMCVNPQHLLIGTHMDNVRDKMIRGRGRYNSTCGEQRHNAKLKTADIYFIRNSNCGDSELGRKYGVSATAINYVRKRKSWRHL